MTDEASIDASSSEIRPPAPEEQIKHLYLNSLFFIFKILERLKR